MASAFKAIERAMAMDDATWRRHANPLSGWTRVAILPLFALAVWSRVWIGAWAWLAVIAVLAWVWLNPRAFPPPATHAAWMSRGVMGERIFLEHPEDIPAEHRRIAMILSWLSLPGALLLAWGLWSLWWEAVVFGTILAMLPKMWFIDRMVWIEADWRRAGRDVPGWEKEHG